VKLLN
jgi:superfamily II DNA/RNA helicase